MTSPKMVAMLARMLRDLDRAEEIAQDAFVEALTRWTETGIPDNPSGWLMTAARHRAIDALRRARREGERNEALAHVLDDVTPAAFDETSDLVVEDDLLRLVFVACHPVLSEEARVALTLRLLCGLSAEEIARAFLVPETTIAQRITRAKRTIAEQRIPFTLPSSEDLEARLASVRTVVYLVFNAGYSATSGEQLSRPELCDDAIRLGRILAALVPASSEVHGLVALMQIQASRSRARVGPSGDVVLLGDQDRSRWDDVLIEHGLAALVRGEACLEGAAPGPYLVEAAIAACHARARHAADTDWARIAVLYDLLMQIAPSPIVALNRAVAHGKTFGPERGLALTATLVHEPALRAYPFLPSVRAAFFHELGRHDEAQAQIARAIALTRNAKEKALLHTRALAYAKSSDTP